MEKILYYFYYSLIRFIKVKSYHLKITFFYYIENNFIIITFTMDINIKFL